MGRKEYLEEKYVESRKKWLPLKAKYYANPATSYVAPFQIADNLYYVGDKQVCIHLIDTGDGLILLDSGFPCATYLLIESIFRAGFDPKDVKWILHTHGHFDHFGAAEAFRTLYGTKSAIGRVDAQALREMPHRAHLDLSALPHAYIPTFDRELEDGEVFELGNTKIRCVLTPGHTPGVLTFFFDVTWEGKTYLAGLFGGAGTNAMTRPYTAHNAEPLNATDMMLDSIDRIWNEPVVVHLGNHPYNNRTMQKRAKQVEEGGNPFIAPDSWHSFLTELREDTLAIKEKNRAMDAEMEALFGKE